MQERTQALRNLKKGIAELKDTVAEVSPMIFALSIGAATRLLFVLSKDFPINDGGMFYTMTQELKDSHFVLPVYTSYNSANIPFTYPPLPFYIAAFISSFLPIQLIDILRFLPVVFSILLIPAFYLLCRQLLLPYAALFSIFIFAMLPRSFEWQIMGGGLTRSLGFLFCLLTIYCGINSYRRPDNKNLILSITFLSLTILSHFEWSFFAIISLAIIFLHFAKDIKVTLKLLRIIVGALFFTSPWWLLLIIRHGLVPFISFSRAGFYTYDTAAYLQLLTLRITDEPFLTLMGVFGLLGLVVSVAKKEIWLPAWLVLPLFLAPRSFPNLATIPLVILAGVALSDMFLPALIKKSPPKYCRKYSKERVKRFEQTLQDLPHKGLFLFLMIYILLSTWSLLFIENWYYFGSVSLQERGAMDWIRHNTRMSDKFLLITQNPVGIWGMDNVSEWFPALTERTSIITPQGYEWLPNLEFYKRVKFYNQVKECYDKDLVCLESVVQTQGKDFSHIYIYKPDKDSIDRAPLIRRDLTESPNYSTVHDGPGATVFARKNAL